MKIINKLALDTNILGQLLNPSPTKFTELKVWFRAILLSDAEVFLPGIVDYEMRRSLELQRLKDPNYRGVERLNRFLQSVRYLPITITDLNLAATLWAEARYRGQKTEPDRDLGGDPILAAQVRSLFSPWVNVVLVTENRKHLTRYGIDARSFQEILFPGMES
ncbi:nucleic acid-binding protein [Limnothrix sp. FACHB-708]|uniref:type II toxin-antitoxin system VapC family toxin n=1 Tax=unclassified Limnothrix TaxID=2632864 RepID=UPI0016895D1D|nr:MULTISPECIES: PIN domain-containing protein [unclassified Limnothrix]MBD2552577.1 nucleic acid-binding protein [Limnothrix sp. FACHB-708]MBD2589847.1 nucleic acid-binding protein [Limnothrix sp. FACHB-406]